MKFVARRLLLILVLLFVAFGLLAWRNFTHLPTRNTESTHFDCIVVLGNPAEPDGSASPEERERVLEGIREYRAGVAPRLIMTGGAAHNRFVEADVMARFARSQGVPAEVIVEDPRALNTIQNIDNSAQIMHAHGWDSAEIVSSPYHLGRTALILAAFNQRQPALHLDWRTHPAQMPPEYGVVHRALLYSVEAWRCQLHILGFPHHGFDPAPAH